MPAYKHVRRRQRVSGEVSAYLDHSCHRITVWSTKSVIVPSKKLQRKLLTSSPFSLQISHGLHSIHIHGYLLAISAE